MALLRYKLDRCKNLPKLVAVVGGKNSGKTTIIENLIAELKRRKYHVGAVKEMVRIATLDTPATETDRYSNAGAEIIVAVPQDETVVFINKRLSVEEILPHLDGLDYVILEGFEHEQKVPKIIAAKTADEAKSYLDSLAVSISGLITESEEEMKKTSTLKIPLFKSLTEAGKLADLVEKKAVTLKQ
jgi:molybdopterin-guanine dinucleotide biosynthesis protein B